jgi:hypothetical protein
MLTGYLISVFGRPVIFPSKESYESGVEVEGIRLFNATFPVEIEKRMKTGVWPVMVIGKFDAKFLGETGARLGAITNTQSVMMAYPGGVRPNGSGGE